jgi:hypothetical protein
VKNREKGKSTIIRSFSGLKDRFSQKKSGKVEERELLKLLFLFPANLIYIMSSKMRISLSQKIFSSSSPNFSCKYQSLTLIFKSLIKNFPRIQENLFLISLPESQKHFPHILAWETSLRKTKTQFENSSSIIINFRSKRKEIIIIHSPNKSIFLKNSKCFPNQRNSNFHL